MQAKIIYTLKGKINNSFRNDGTDFITKTKARANAKNRRKKNCEFCGFDKDLHLHHPNYKSNKGVTLCRKCHLKIHSLGILMQEKKCKSK